MDQQPITPPRHQHQAHQHRHHRPNTTVTVHLHRHRNPGIRTRDTKGISVKGTLHHRHRRSHLSLTKSTIVSITNTNPSPVVPRSFEAGVYLYTSSISCFARIICIHPILCCLTNRSLFCACFSTFMDARMYCFCEL